MRQVNFYFRPNGLKSDKYKELNLLQQDDSLNTMDLYKLFVDDSKKATEFDTNIVVDKRYILKTI